MTRKYCSFNLPFLPPFTVALETGPSWSNTEARQSPSLQQSAVIGQQGTHNFWMWHLYWKYFNMFVFVRNQLIITECSVHLLLRIVFRETMVIQMKNQSVDIKVLLHQNTQCINILAQAPDTQIVGYVCMTMSRTKIIYNQFYNC